jgi:hypothetical protein
VGNSNLKPASVGAGNLQADAVTGGTVVDHSLSVADLAGVDATFGISFSLAGGACNTFNLGVPGVHPLQNAFLSFFNSVPTPNLVFQPVAITAVDSVELRVCNVSAATANVTNLGIRLTAFG